MLNFWEAYLQYTKEGTMGSRDIRKKQAKKPKKDAKRNPQVSIIAPQPAVEIIRKPKKHEGREGDEE